MTKVKKGQEAIARHRLITDREQYRNALYKLLTSRPSKVRIATYEANDVQFDSGHKLGDLIRRLLGQGAVVTILVGKLDDDSKKFLSKVDSNGAKVYVNKRIHAKVISWEGQDVKKIMVGSANMTNGGLYDNHEVDMFLDPVNGITFTQLGNWFNTRISASRRLEEYVV